MDGHPCPDCLEAVKFANAMGPSARGQAVLVHHKRTGRTDAADAMRRMLVEGRRVRVPAWAVVGQPPFGRPWKFLEKRLMRLS